MQRFLAIAALCLLAAPAHVHAQLFRAYLSIKGADTNPCTLQAPCRLLPAALSAVADGGEIWMLDSANFNTGTVTVGKSASIQAVPGQVGSLVAQGGTAAMSISASGAKVGLRNLAFVSNATSPGTDGVDVANAAMVSVEDCLFAGLPGQAIKAANNAVNLHVRNTVFRNGAQYGIWAESGPSVDVVHSQFVENSGVLAFSHVASTVTSVSVADSAISGSNWGVVTNSDAAGSAQIFVTRSTIYHTAFGGLVAQYNGAGTSLVTVAGSSVRDNSLGYVQQGSAVVKSFGNNDIDGNNGNSGTLSTASFR